MKNKNTYIIGAILIGAVYIAFLGFSEPTTAAESCANLRGLAQADLQACRDEASTQVSFYQTEYQREAEHAALLREELAVTEANLRSFNSLAESERVKIRIIDRMLAGFQSRQ